MELSTGRALRDSAIAPVCSKECRLNPYHPRKDFSF